MPAELFEFDSGIDETEEQRIVRAPLGTQRAVRRVLFMEGGELTLSIDQLVAGFLDGIEKFKECAIKDRKLRNKFLHYITS